MDDVETSFGQKLLGANSALEMIALERSDDRSTGFAQVDLLINELMSRSLKAARIATLEGERGNTILSIDGLDESQQTFLDDYFAMERQQSRGSWFLPKSVNLTIGWLNLPFYFNQNPSDATSIAAYEMGRV